MKILIVDDSSFAQKNVSRLFLEEFPDAEIKTANNGIEGFELCKKFIPDYIFIDLLMPEMNGKELIMALKESNISSNIIVVSADIQNEVRKEIEDMGIFQFINKPFNRDKAQKLWKLIREDIKE